MSDIIREEHNTENAVDFFAGMASSSEDNSADKEVNGGMLEEKELEADDFLNLFDDAPSSVCKESIEGKTANISTRTPNRLSNIGKFLGKRWVKFGLFGLGVLVLSCGVCFSLVLGKQDKKVESEVSIPKEKYLSDDLITKEDVDLDTGVLGWCNAFLCKDFESCDEISNVSGYGIMGFDDYTNADVVSNTVYNIMYEKLADSVQSIEVVNKTESSNGDTVYALKVSYIPYKNVEALDLDLSEYERLCEGYVAGTVNKDDFKTGLEGCFATWFRGCFAPESSEYVFTFDLAEKKTSTGAYIVPNTTGFMTKLLRETNVQSVELVFENNVTSQLDIVLGDY